MGNWKTTIGGALSALGVPLTTSSVGWVHTLGLILTTAGPLLLGWAAQDAKKAAANIVPIDPPTK